jgi:hypothetical protein
VSLNARPPRLEALERRDVPAAPVIPETPSVPTLLGTLDGNVRTYDLTASQFTQQIANFPIKTAQFWGYNGSTPGPTLVAYEGEEVRVVVHNQLPKPTTVHFHGMHQPNEDDGVAGISQPDPIQPGDTFTYDFTPFHTGTFGYHSHTTTAVEDLRGLGGMFIILPKDVPDAERVDRDFAMTLQQFAPPGEGKLVDPFPPGTGDFPFSTINGKTGDASGGAINVKLGEKIQIRLYNASNLSHSMHLHGQHFTEVARNGHPLASPITDTTVNVAPGEFVDIQFAFDQPGNWIFHCHVPHHTSNKMQDGYNGAPVGMTRIFHTEGFEDVRPEYFAYQGPKPPAAPAPALASGPDDGTARVVLAGGGSLSPGDQITFFPGFPGEVRVASADVNGDNVPDFIGGAGPGGGPRVRVIDGKSGATLADLFAFEPGFTGGVNVAAGDLNGDGKADIVVSADTGGGPRVVVFSGANFNRMADFFGIDDPNFRGGARVAIGDFNGDKTDDLAVAAGTGGGPRVAMFDGKSVSAGAPVRLAGDRFVFEESVRDGVYIAAGDLNADGFADLVAGGGPGGGPRVLALSGKALMQGQSKSLADFFSGDPAGRGGVRVAVKMLDADSSADILAGSGADGGGHVIAYSGATLPPTGTPPEMDRLDLYDGYKGGVFVG